MAITISRKELLKELMPGIKALFGIKSTYYEVKKKERKYEVLEIYNDVVNSTSKVIATGLTKKEAEALLKLTTKGEQHEY